jgi:4-amino-4-deoxychorismate lyase
MAVQVLVTLDGTVLDPKLPLLTADDLAAVRGDGVFETLLVRDGAPREEGPHLARLARSAAMLDLPEPDLDRWRGCIATVLEHWEGRDDFALRLILSRGGESSGTATGYATGSPISATVLAQQMNGLAAVTLDRGVSSDAAERAPWLLLGAKTLSYAVNMAALRHAGRLGAEDVVFISTDGYVLEGPTSTVVLATGRTLRTPPAEAGILPGTTQGVLFRAAERAGWACEVGPVRAEDLLTADGVWLASSIRLLARVHTLDGEALGDAATGARLTTELQQLLAGA